MKELNKAIKKAKRKHPGFDVVEISDERSFGNHIYVYFSPGWQWSEEQIHFVHGKNFRDVIDDLNNIEPCNCEQCQMRM